MSSERILGGETGAQGVLSWKEGQPWTLSHVVSSGGMANKPGESLSTSLSHTALKDMEVTVGEGRKRPSKRGGDSEHDVHIWAEKERRKKMKNMFTGLHALLPHVPPKADKATIVDEAVNYIQKLQQNLQKLEKKRMEKMREAMRSSSLMAIQGAQSQLTSRESTDKKTSFVPMSSPACISVPRLTMGFETWTSPNVVLNIAGEEGHINICAAKKPGHLSPIFRALEKHNLELVSASLSSDNFRTMYMIHARASRVSDKFPETLMIQDIFKSAVSEIIHLISS